jgi:hypothetical protein
MCTIYFVTIVKFLFLVGCTEKLVRLVGVDRLHSRFPISAANFAMFISVLEGLHKMKSV